MLRSAKTQKQIEKELREEDRRAAVPDQVVQMHINVSALEHYVKWKYDAIPVETLYVSRPNHMRDIPCALD